MIGKDIDEQIVDKVNAIENTRVLLGFMGRDIAVQRLQNAHTFRNPVDPTLDEEEILSMREEREEEFIDTWANANSSIVDPPSFIAGSVDHEPLAQNENIEEYLTEFATQDHFQALVEDIPDGQWGFRLVPLKQIVAFQPSVTTSGHVDIPTRDDGLLDVVKYCLPIRGNKYIMTRPIPSNDRLGFELISRGPNIDVAGANFTRDEETDTISINFEIKPRVNIVQIVHFQNRFILKNGYHRCFQLLSAGETHVPAFVREVGNYEETGGAQPEMFSQSLVMSNRPPLLSDFFTDAAVDLDSPGFNKVIRIVAETSNIRR